MLLITTILSNSSNDETTTIPERSSQTGGHHDLILTALPSIIRTPAPSISNLPANDLAITVNEVTKIFLKANTGLTPRREKLTGNKLASEPVELAGILSKLAEEKPDQFAELSKDHSMLKRIISKNIYHQRIAIRTKHETNWQEQRSELNALDLDKQEKHLLLTSLQSTQAESGNLATPMSNTNLDRNIENLREKLEIPLTRYVDYLRAGKEALYDADFYNSIQQVIQYFSIVAVLPSDSPLTKMYTTALFVNVSNLTAAVRLRFGNDTNN